MGEKVLFINGRFLSQKVTGVQRVAHEMTFRINGNEVLATPKGKFSILYEQLVLPIKIRDKGPLISFCNIGPIIVRNQYLYIHDVAVFENPNWFSKAFRIYYKIMWPILSRRVKRIITVSNFSKSEIVKFLKVPSEKVKVIYNGVSDAFDIEKYSPTLPREKIILTVGSVEPRKNLRNVLEAWNKTKLRKSGYRLIVVGGKYKSFSNDDIPELDQSVEFTGYISDDELKRYYFTAKGFIYMSLYEGFGLPVLEAMLSKTPVLTSSTTSLLEIADGYAKLADPLNVDMITKQIDSLPYTKASDVELAYQYANQFTWESSTRNLTKFINECENETS